MDSLDTLARIAGAALELREAGTCSHPIRLVGGREVIEKATGLLLESKLDRVISVPCGTRRASRCAYCSTLYKFDAYNLIAAVLRGGKQTPDAVAGHPRLFVTMTAPSFGPVHLGQPGRETQGPATPGATGPGAGATTAPETRRSARRFTPRPTTTPATCCSTRLPNGCGRRPPPRSAAPSHASWECPGAS